MLRTVPVQTLEVLESRKLLVVKAWPSKTPLEGGPSSVTGADGAAIALCDQWGIICRAFMYYIGLDVHKKRSLSCSAVGGRRLCFFGFSGTRSGTGFGSGFGSGVLQPENKSIATVNPTDGAFVTGSPPSSDLSDALVALVVAYPNLPSKSFRPQFMLWNIHRIVGTQSIQELICKSHSPSSGW